MYLSPYIGIEKTGLKVSNNSFTNFIPSVPRLCNISVISLKIKKLSTLVAQTF